MKAALQAALHLKHPVQCLEAAAAAAQLTVQQQQLQHSWQSQVAAAVPVISSFSWSKRQRPLQKEKGSQHAMVARVFRHTKVRVQET
jgi:hypothetical protein